MIYQENFALSYIQNVNSGYIFYDSCMKNTFLRKVAARFFDKRGGE